MSEQIESLGTSADSKQVTLQDEYLLLYALQIGAIDFRQFLDKSLQWAQKVLDTEK